MADWTDWHGGECPIPDAKAKEIEFRTREGIDYKIRPDEASDCNWHHACNGSILSLHDIIAYRLIEQEQSDLDWMEREIWEMLNSLPDQDPLSGTARAVALHEVITLIKQRKGEK
jgi:hypothetical protein